MSDSPIWHSLSGPEEIPMELECLADQLAYFARTNMPNEWRGLMNAFQGRERRAWINRLAEDVAGLIEARLARDAS